LGLALSNQTEEPKTKTRMAGYSYIAVDSRGGEFRGMLDVTTQMEAVRRVREMGLFPTKVKPNPASAARKRPVDRARGITRKVTLPSITLSRRVKSSRLVLFTRQLATMLGAGMPLVRGLRILEEQSESSVFKAIIRDISASIENGSTFSEALAGFPRVFNVLYINLVKAGEAAGALEASLCRLADFLEKAQKLRNKLISAMFYPAAVIVVAGGVLALLMTFVVPSFQRVFDGLLDGRPLPAFTRLIFGLSSALVHQLPLVMAGFVVALVVGLATIKTRNGAKLFDQFKLAVPLLGPLVRKAAISRFARTLGTLAGSGVPILQALIIVRDTAGNWVLSQVIGQVHEQVKQGETIAPVLKASGVFPPMVAGMVDVGEQTGALPDMLMKIADTYDDEFDNTAKGLTSLLEPILIVLLAVIVGSIVIAMFLPLLSVITQFDTTGPGRM
jgi:type IV pilus assembly protein PilC